MKKLTWFRLFIMSSCTFTGCLAVQPKVLPSYRHSLLYRQQEFRTPLPKTDKRSVLPIEGTAELNTIESRLGLAKRARAMLSRPVYHVGASQYRKDCSGFVLSVLAQERIRLDHALLGNKDSSVASIFHEVEKRGLVHRRKVPAIGDLVFFSNTYDRNRDGRLNDPLTHIGIVERVDADGTVTFIHHVRRGVLRYKMNLFNPRMRRQSDTRKVFNHYLRFRSRRPSANAKRLTGELFHAYATLLR